MNLFDPNYPHPILLASTSTYRQTQLRSLGYQFDIDNPNVNEENFKNKSLSPKDVSSQLAALKAASLCHKYPRHIIIGADQVCHLDHQILSKPNTVENAIKQLKLLQGKTHSLTTSINVFFRGKNYPHSDLTQLQMRKLSDKEISTYIELDNPLKCAGSYMFEAHGQRLFSSIQTNDPSSIIGIPMMALQTILLQLANEE